MAKRNADKELNDRNWDQEDEGEEAGVFSLASEDVLKGRAIKKAKRRNAGGEGSGGGTFKGFKGFSLTAPAAGGGPAPFSGFGNGGFKGLGALTNGSSGSPSFGGLAAPAALAPGLAFSGPTPADATAKQTNGTGTALAPACGGSREYSRQLTALNVSVRDWINKHVDDNPLCDLNPIFRDYERHLASIECQYGADRGPEEPPGGPPAAAPPASSSSSSSSSSTAPALFSFTKNTTEDSVWDKGAAGVTFNFGQKVDSSALGPLAPKATPTTFSFSSGPASQQTPLFGGTGSAAPLSVSGTKTEDPQPAEENDEESDEPPKPEVKEVKEKDAFYSKKCKLFYKKDSEFKEKGVGTLHLKLTEGGKTQMIIRADTNLGNILLNIIAQPSMPCSRVGRNNVMAVCVPNPPVDDRNPGGAVPLLIRVKTPEDADELLKVLEERRG
ncbi:nuclear pore complex protein Nup50 [Antennarius striatus]|uniref:nuclear pore complex protein Nup50 n=1 Tax=Antennarius striatus TaxID=241820 RepID=UPI0035AFF19B